MRARFFRRLTILAGVLLASALAVVILLWHLAAIAEGGAPSGHRGLAAGLLGAAVLVLVAVAAALGRTLRRTGGPLRAVMEAAEQVAGGRYDVQVAEAGPPPIRALARSFNTMTARLQRQDRHRRDLMADVAHELRTPLTVVQGRLEGMLDGVYSMDREAVAQVLDDIHLLSRLIEDLRTLALSESGALSLQKETTDLAMLARDTAAAYNGEAAQRRISLEVHASEPASLDVDPVRLRQVLGNLISNALRHTPDPGSIVVRVRPAPRQVELEVQDTGCGMTPEALERAFDRFQKSAESRGAGLGLAIARSLVEAHGGELRATSEPGRGTTMTITLPREPS